MWVGEWAFEDAVMSLRLPNSATNITDLSVRKLAYNVLYRSPGLSTSPSLLHPVVELGPEILSDQALSKNPLPGSS